MTWTRSTGNSINYRQAQALILSGLDVNPLKPLFKSGQEVLEVASKLSQNLRVPNGIYIVLSGYEALNQKRSLVRR
jgi:hypothetical protein